MDWFSTGIPRKKQTRIPDSAYLPPREVANAARNILEQQVALPLVDLMRVTAQLLGYARFGLNVETAMRRGVQILLDGEEVKIEGDKILMK